LSTWLGRDYGTIENKMPGEGSTSGEPSSGGSGRRDVREAVLLASQDAARQAVTHMHGKVPKVAPPKRFSGSRAQLREFLTQCRLYIAFNPLCFDTEERKTLFIVSYFEGSAFKWFDQYLREWLDPTIPMEQKSRETQVLCTNVEALTNKMIILWGEEDEEGAAERRLKRLRQTGTVANYLSEFEQWAPRTKWDDHAFRFQFYDGLKDSIKDDIARGAKPTTLVSLQKVALQIGERQQERQLERRGWKPYPHRRVTEPMELDAAQRDPRKGTFKKGKKGQRSKPKGKCYNCGIEGHFANDCRKPKKDGQRTAATASRARKSPKKRTGDEPVREMNCATRAVEGDGDSNDSSQVSDESSVDSETPLIQKDVRMPDIPEEPEDGDQDESESDSESEPIGEAQEADVEHLTVAQAKLIHESLS